MAQTKKVSKKAKPVELDVKDVVEDQPLKETEVKPVGAETGDQDELTDAVTAKAGKKSTKAKREAFAKLAKEERKAQATETGSEKKPKQPLKPTRSRLARRGKKFQAAAQKIDKTKNYSPSEALELATQTSPVKFDAAIELHVNLRVDPKQADQNIRDSIVLPAGTGKVPKIAVFSDEKVIGADISGVETLTKALEKGTFDFDILIATPATMPTLGKFARFLGPRGLMPNPKSGTVTSDLVKAVAEAKAGRVEYRVDSTGIIHLGIGKVSFGRDRLLENFNAVLASVKTNKPNSVKDSYITSVHVATSMGPSIGISISDL
ncbi:MAG: 50S ribosomal protein L1 [Candidatus Saccharimonadales bacterium]